MQNQLFSIETISILSISLIELLNEYDFHLNIDLERTYKIFLGLYLQDIEQMKTCNDVKELSNKRKEFFIYRGV